jgi:hypothetical protein
LAQVKVRQLAGFAPLGKEFLGNSAMQMGGSSRFDGKFWVRLIANATAKQAWLGISGTSGTHRKWSAGCVMGNHATGLGIVGSPAENAVRITCRPREFIILARKNGTLQNVVWKNLGQNGKKFRH